MGESKMAQRTFKTKLTGKRRAGKPKFQKEWKPWECEIGGMWPDQDYIK